jgi:hypothetical protein
MTVKNISKYHQLSVEELNKLGTRELVNALESARGRAICSCGKSHHCGDDVLDQEERDWNKKQSELFLKLKDILKDREDVTRKDVPKKAQKKKMKY